jgi:hypothetical protein
LELEMSSFYVEFEIGPEEGLSRLSSVFEALRAAKSSGDWRDDDYWLDFFDSEARTRFWWPSTAERDEWLKRWLSTPVPQRFHDPSLVTPWDFGSMIDAFRNGDYELLSCERVSERIGQLSFDPLGWPYGGTECMRALIEAFGHRVTNEVI